MAQQIKRGKDDNSINLVDLSFYLLNHWYWFVLCILLACGYAYYKYSKTPFTYRADATVIIKDPSNSRSTARLDNYTNLMSLEEEKAYSDMVDAYMLMKSDSSALEVAQENYRLANLNYEAGNATLSEVLQAHALLLQAENAITDRRTTYVVARRRLLDLREN